MLATCMTTPTALDSFIDKWRSRWPEWSVAEVFMAPDRRERSLAWFALLQEFEDILNVAGDPLPADAKLGWWASELRDWQGQRSRHPLGRQLEPLPAPRALLADALPSLVAARERPRDGDAALAALTAYTGAVAEVEAVVLGGSRAAPAALAAQVLAGRLAAAGTVALPLVLEPGSAAAPEAAAAASRAWAGQLLARWPARSGASRARRMYARCARHRLQQLAAGRTPQPGRQPLGQLWRVWRAASGGP